LERGGGNGRRGKGEKGRGRKEEGSREHKGRDLDFPFAKIPAGVHV